MLSGAVLLLLFSAVSALKFPGKCPNVPPSHFFPITSEEPPILNFLYAAPFSAETPSYLFLDLRTPDQSHYYLTQKSSISGSEQNYTINLWYWNIEQDHILIKSVANRQGDQVLLNSSVFHISEEEDKYITIGCHLPILEEVHIWIEDDIMFIWSCVDLKDKGRDEALFIFYLDMSEYLYVTEPSEANRLTPTIVKQVAKKYVSDALVQIITVGTQTNINNREKIGFIPFACPAGPVPVAILIGMFLVFLGVLGACWYFNK